MDRKISVGSLSIPAVGLGTYLCSDEEARVAVAHALKIGYRHIDTAEFYANHKGIAAGIAEAGVPREEIFITDKVNPGGIFGQPGKTFEEIQTSMKAFLAQLGCDYVDLFLIHHAGAKEQRLDQWRALVALQKEGLAKHIGVSNFCIAHLEEIKNAGLPLPAVNQIEIHPLCTQTALVKYMREHQIMPVAYSSLAPASTWRTGANQGSGKTEAHVTHHAVVDAMLEKYQVNEAQLLLRWALQHDYCIIPKSSKVERIEQNTQLFHFEIDAGDMAALDGLDENLALAWPNANPLDFGL